MPSPASQKTSATVPLSPDVLIQRARDMVPVLASRAKETEEARMVPVETVREMQEAGFFRVLQPKLYGGYEMDPQVFYDIVMTLAEGCMSTAWIYGVIGVHNWQIALFDPRAAADVWKDDTDVRIASTYMPKGQVKPVDVAFIRKDLKANVKLDAYDYTVYGSLKGHVTYISADTLDEELKKDEEPYYRVHIQIDSFPEQHRDKIDVIPGMTAKVEIITGERTVAQYVLKPLRRISSEALVER